MALYCLNFFHSYSIKYVLKKHENVCKSHNHCYVEVPKDDNKVLKCNHGEKYMKFPFIIYVDLESLLEKTNTCHDNPEKSLTIKINKHIASGYSLFTRCSFDATKKLNWYRGKDCIEIFCIDLKKHAKTIINYKKKKKKWYH